MSNGELASVIFIAGAITSVVMSGVKRFYPEIKPFWRNAVLLLIALLSVWGYQLYNVGFEKIMDDPIGTILSMFAVTGFAVAVYEAIGKPTTISPRLEGSYVEPKKKK